MQHLSHIYNEELINKAMISILACDLRTYKLIGWRDIVQGNFGGAYHGKLSKCSCPLSFVVSDYSEVVRIVIISCSCIKGRRLEGGVCVGVSIGCGWRIGGGCDDLCRPIENNFGWPSVSGLHSPQIHVAILAHWSCLPFAADHLIEVQ